MYKTEIEIASIANPKLNTKIGEIKKQGKGAKIVSLKKDLNLLLITDESMKDNDRKHEVGNKTNDSPQQVVKRLLEHLHPCLNDHI